MTLHNKSVHKIFVKHFLSCFASLFTPLIISDVPLQIFVSLAMDVITLGQIFESTCDVLEWLLFNKCGEQGHNWPNEGGNHTLILHARLKDALCISVARGKLRRGERISSLRMTLTHALLRPVESPTK